MVIDLKEFLSVDPEAVMMKKDYHQTLRDSQLVDAYFFILPEPSYRCTLPKLNKAVFWYVQQFRVSDSLLDSG
ncbi:unnamed protein product [Brassica napus]|nr:unnamed protein product [Brassica napus]